MEERNKGYRFKSSVVEMNDDGAVDGNKIIYLVVILNFLT